MTKRTVDGEKFWWLKFQGEPVTDYDWLELQGYVDDGRIPTSGEICKPILFIDGNVEFDIVDKKTVLRTKGD